MYRVTYGHQLPTTETTLVRKVMLYCTAHIRTYMNGKRMASQTSVCVSLPSLVDANCTYLAAVTPQGSV